MKIFCANSVYSTFNPHILTRSILFLRLKYGLCLRKPSTLVQNLFRYRVVKRLYYGSCTYHVSIVMLSCHWRVLYIVPNPITLFLKLPQIEDFLNNERKIYVACASSINSAFLYSVMNSIWRSWVRASQTYFQVQVTRCKFHNLFVLWNALHISGRSSSHYQKLKTVYTPSGTLSDLYCYPSRQWQVTVKVWQSTRCCIYSFESLWWAKEPPETCRSFHRNK